MVLALAVTLTLLAVATAVAPTATLLSLAGLCAGAIARVRHEQGRRRR